MATVTIKAPNFQTAVFKIKGTAPLVIHRFSAKTKEQMRLKMETGKAAGSRKDREAKSTDSLYEDSRYRSAEGWDGFNAAAIRLAMIDACRLVGFKMNYAKMSVFVDKDGVDVTPIRLAPKPSKLHEHVKTMSETKQRAQLKKFFKTFAPLRLAYADVPELQNLFAEAERIRRTFNIF